MIRSTDKYRGTRYTMTIALLLAAFVVSPMMLFLSEPTGYIAISVAVIFSLACVVIARLHWMKYSNLTLPSLETQRGRTK